MHIQNLNPNEDYHTHTLNFSDGFNTIDEMVVMAGKIGLSKIVFTDHSQASLNVGGIEKKNIRRLIDRYKNVLNDVKVEFSVEADLLNEQGDVCFDIQGYEAEKFILSAHPEPYQGNPKFVTEAYVHAIRRYADKILFLGHVCSKYFDNCYVDIDRIIDMALEYDVAFELNCANLVYGKTNLEKLHRVLHRANRLYVNSDAHNLNELMNARKFGIKFLEKHGYI